MCAPSLAESSVCSRKWKKRVSEGLPQTNLEFKTLISPSTVGNADSSDSEASESDTVQVIESHWMSLYYTTQSISSVPFFCSMSFNFFERVDHLTLTLQFFGREI